MDTTHEDINKISSFQSGKTKVVRKNQLDRYELVEQFKSLQKAFAHERGENHRFREEVRTLLRQNS